MKSRFNLFLIYSISQTVPQGNEGMDALRCWGTQTNISSDAVAKNYWIFQGNPKVFDIDGYVNENEKITWTVKRYIKEIKVGDEVWIWRSKSKASPAGIIAKTVVIDKPEMMLDDPYGEKYWRSNANEQFTEVHRAQLEVLERSTENVIPRDAVVQDSIVGNSLIIKQPAGSNFKINEEENAAIQRLWEDRLNLTSLAGKVKMTRKS